MKTIKSLEQIRNISGRVYVRWSGSISQDNQRGYSLRYGNQAEAGLSCCEIDKTWDDWRILRQLTEYRFCGGYCWIITGDEAGTGGDNEPLLRNVKAVGKVSDKLLSANWRKMQLEREMAVDEARLARATDPIGRKIIAQSIERSRLLISRQD